MYSEISQVKEVKWSHVQNPHRSLQTTAVLGRIKTSVALPVTPETAGQYTCTLSLKNGNKVEYMFTVAMADIGESSLYSLLLIYLIALTICCLSIFVISIPSFQGLDHPNIMS